MKSQEIEYTEHKPRPLHTEFYRDGMLHKQVRRTGNVAEFSISGGGCEIIRIRVAKPQKTTKRGDGSVARIISINWGIWSTRMVFYAGTKGQGEQQI